MHDCQMKSYKSQREAESHSFHCRITQEITAKVRMGENKETGPRPAVHGDSNNKSSYGYEQGNDNSKDRTAKTRRYHKSQRN
ncbi:hypothetical protein D3C81_2150030 [compost metagenome]